MTTITDRELKIKLKLSKRIREEKKKRGLTILQIADKSGYSISCITNILNPVPNRKDISVGATANVAQSIGIRINALKLIRHDFKTSEKQKLLNKINKYNLTKERFNQLFPERKKYLFNYFLRMQRGDLIALGYERLKFILNRLESLK